MPSEILSRIPLPSLRVYTSVSVALVAVCLYYSFNVTSDPSWKQNVNLTLHYPPVSLTENVPVLVPPTEAGLAGAGKDAVLGEQQDLIRPMGLSRTVMDQFRDMMSFMGQEAICIWVSNE